MPQLGSRLDSSGWLTPSIADILEPAGASTDEAAIRLQAGEIQYAFAENGTPLKIMTVRPNASRTLYITRPDSGSRYARKATMTAVEVKHAFARLAEQHPDWLLGFVPAVQDKEALGILIRTPQNQPLRLRQLLIRSPYREYPSTLAVALGVTLENQLVVRDMQSMGHLLITGDGSSQRQFLWSLLLTLMLFNTPSELRLALAGTSSLAYIPVVDAPHVLGRPLAAPRDGQRLFDGLVREVQRRFQWFEELRVSTLDDYNLAMQNLSSPVVPRIVLLVDSLSDPDWKSAADRWLPSLHKLALNGARAGIHLLLTASQTADLPESLAQQLPAQVILQPDREVYGHQVRLSRSAWRFVDALLVESGGAVYTPLESASVLDDEIQRAVAYWQYATAQRVVEAAGETHSSGVTGVFRAITVPDNDAPPASPAPPAPSKPDAGILARAAHALATPGKENVIRQAEALAAYLGWLGAGPLQDVLGLSPAEAQTTLTALQNQGILEAGSSPTPRFNAFSKIPPDGAAG